MLEKRLQKNKEKTEIPHWNILIIICGVSIIQLNVLLLSRIQNRYLSILLSVSVLLVDLLIFYLYDVLVKAYRNLAEKAELEKQTLIYANQLEVLTQSEDQIKSVRHDMKKIISQRWRVWRNREKSEEVTAYIAQIGEHMENPEERVKSGNENLDSLLNYFLGKSRAMSEAGGISGAGTKRNGGSCFDINVILGNLMDNAIEAAAVSAEKISGGSPELRKWRSCNRG